MKKVFKILILWFIIGMVYFTMEGFWRIKQGGWSNISMLVVGGFCGLVVGSINQIPRFYKMPIWMQSLIGTLITILVEFISGIFLNKILGLNIWDYTGKPLNIMGQVCLPYSILWFLLMPLAIWLEDALRFILFKERSYYTLKSIYIEFITGK